MYSDAIKMANVCSKQMTDRCQNVHFQFGLYRYDVNFSGSKMEELFEMAADVVLRTYPHLSRSPPRRGLVDNLMILFQAYERKS